MYIYEIVIDLRNWFYLLGYDLSSLIPDVDFWGNLRNQKHMFLNKMGRNNQQPSTLSTYQCAFERSTAEIFRLTMVPPSALVTSPSDGNQVSLSPLPNIFGSGITLALKDGQHIYVEMLDTANEILLNLATTLLNNSELIGLQIMYHSHDAFYFVRGNLEEASADIKELQLHGFDNINGINVTVHRHQDASTQLVKFVDIRLAANHTLFNIRYGTTMRDEERRVLHHAMEKAASDAWKIEQETALSSQPSAYQWSDSELKELLNSGSVSTYSVEHVHNPRIALQLAQDPRNIRFVKTSR